MILIKFSDYIAYIHEGKLLFFKPYDKIIEDYGIINGNKDTLETLNEDDVIAYIKKPYSYSILVNNRYAIQKIIPDLEIIRPTIEEIMLFYAKGVNKTC